MSSHTTRLAHFESNGLVPGLGHHNASPNGQPNGTTDSPSGGEKDVDAFLQTIFGVSAVQTDQQLPSPSTTGNSVASIATPQPPAHVTAGAEMHSENRHPHALAAATNGLIPHSPTTPKSPESLTTVPQIMLFGPAPEQWDTIMSKACLEKLPNKTLAKLAKNGVMEGTIIKMSNYHQYENMCRLKNYLEQGTYQPFKPLTTLEVDINGSIQSWTPKKETMLQAVNATSTTQQLFLREIDLYLFAVDLEYNELRAVSSENLIDKYPKTVQGIWQLVSSLYKVAEQQGDKQLKDHINDCIYANCKELTKLQQYIPFMKKLNKSDGTLGAVLFESYITASEHVRRKNVEYQKKEAALASRKDQPSKDKAHESSPSSHAASSGALRPEDLPRIAQAIVDGSLVISMEEGYGTLTKVPGLPARNRNFVFQSGELLLANHLEAATNGHNNLIVYNNKGERGDILKQLVREVPKHLGVLGKGKLRSWRFD
jgi:hypothetical protein